MEAPIGIEYPTLNCVLQKEDGMFYCSSVFYRGWQQYFTLLQVTQSFYDKVKYEKNKPIVYNIAKYSFIRNENKLLIQTLKREEIINLMRQNLCNIVWYQYREREALLESDTFDLIKTELDAMS